MSTPRPPRESATVILLRDGARGLETYMVRRHLNSDFVGGAYVFPGGALDEADCDPDLAARYAGLPPEDAGARLSLPPLRALGHYGCAIRETFEEAGVLLAACDGAPVAMADDHARAHWDAQRHALLDKRLSWAALLSQERLTLSLDAMHYFSHWITPEGAPKRFTTRFFVAIAPSDQAPLIDAREVIGGEWVSPATALERHARGEFPMIFPTLKTLDELAGFADAASLVASLKDRRVEPILPRAVDRNGQGVLLIPGDPGYDEAAGRPNVPFDPSRPL